MWCNKFHIFFSSSQERRKKNKEKSCKLLLIWREKKLLKINLVQLSNLNDDIFRMNFPIAHNCLSDSCLDGCSLAFRWGEEQQLSDNSWHRFVAKVKLAPSAEFYPFVLRILVRRGRMCECNWKMRVFIFGRQILLLSVSILERYSSFPLPLTTSLMVLELFSKSYLRFD